MAFGFQFLVSKARNLLGKSSNLRHRPFFSSKRQQFFIDDRYQRSYGGIYQGNIQI